MYHQNFYHWHARAELKPETSILEPRWNAAAKFAEKLSANDVRDLLCLAMFSGASSAEFEKRFGDSLVKAEPTFPIENNHELLRVMAAASLYSRLEKVSSTADAIALGMHSAAFPAERAMPVTPDLVARAHEYLSSESERVRPKIATGAIEKTEKQAETLLNALKAAIPGNSPQEVGKATEALGRGILSAVKESHQQLGEVIERLAEESQFLWWLVGRRSDSLNARRESLTAESYALPAATEAAERVGPLPPAQSTEFLLDEALSQSGKPGRSASVPDLLQSLDKAWLEKSASACVCPPLTPIAALLVELRTSSKLDNQSLKKLRIPAKTRVTPAELARQYFRELVFIRAAESLS